MSTDPRKKKLGVFIIRLTNNLTSIWLWDGGKLALISVIAALPMLIYIIQGYMQLEIFIQDGKQTFPGYLFWLKDSSLQQLGDS